jgi:hypothetical protein
MSCSPKSRNVVVWSWHYNIRQMSPAAKTKGHPKAAFLRISKMNNYSNLNCIGSVK